VDLQDAQGSLQLSTRMGDITVTGASQAILSLSADNGKVNFNGSLAERAAHSLETGFGDIALTLPSSSAFTLDLETRFGDIHSEIPVLAAGALSSGSSNQNHLQGQMNGGGQTLRVYARSGSINIYAAPGQP
jgi:DUF4097 and DUF4098 domain-containing protein YvlB